MNSIIGKRWDALGLAVFMMIASTTALSRGQTAQAQLVSANTGFGFRLLKELAREQNGADVFISPYSIWSVLQMVSTGARGKTEQELQRVLGTSGVSPEDVNSAYASLGESISSTQSNLLLNIANAIWYRRGAQLNSDFAAINQKFYHAELAGLDFSAPASVERMNHWASENTHGRIQTLIQPPIPADTAMVLANAIYFKGTWLKQFDAKQTRERAFHLTGGGQRQVQMMAQTGTFSYQSGSGFQAVQLPYSGKRLVMQVFLPAPNSTIEAMLDEFDGPAWQKNVAPGFGQHKGTLLLPRLKLRYGAELKGPLAALGLSNALSPSADFSGMSPSRLYLSEVKHQSFVEVNEQGTEAAAVTTGVMALASMANQPTPFQMIVDRPFLFVISDQSTGTVLFMGLVSDPQGSS